MNSGKGEVRVVETLVLEVHKILLLPLILVDAASVACLLEEREVCLLKKRGGLEVSFTRRLMDVSLLGNYMYVRIPSNLSCALC